MQTSKQLVISFTCARLEFTCTEFLPLHSCMMNAGVLRFLVAHLVSAILLHTPVMYIERFEINEL